MGINSTDLRAGEKIAKERCQQFLEDGKEEEKFSRRSCQSGEIPTRSKEICSRDT